MRFKKRSRVLVIAGLMAMFAAIAVACSSDPEPLDENAIRSAVQDAVRDAVPAPEPAVSADEIRQLVEAAVSAAAPESASAEDIRAMVEDAVSAASQPGVTAAEVKDLVGDAVASGISEATAGQADQLTADQVKDIVDDALAALPAPEPVVVIATPAPPGEPVRIGTLLDFTGDLGVFGKPMRNGVDLAVDLLNQAGGLLDGRQVRAVHKDSGTSSQIATDAARALILTEGVEAIVGSLSSGVTQAVAISVTIPNEVVLISPASTSPSLTVIDDNDFLFRSTVSDAAQGVVLARLARELGYDSAAALYINNAYGEGLANVFKNSFEDEGGSVTDLVPQESGQATYTSELRRATDGSPDVLIAIGYPESAGVYLREALEGAFIDEFLFVDGTKSQDLFDGIGVESFEGAFGTAPGTPESDASLTFRGLYEARFGELPTNPFIGEAFDAFIILALAIEKAGSTSGVDIRDAMRDVANAPGIKVGPGDLDAALDLIRDGKDIDYEGVAGSQNFDENGDVLNSIEIWKIEGGVITSTGRFESP